MSFSEQIAPFFWVETTSGFSACLDAGDYKNEVFQARAEEGFEGNGYDWTSLAQVYLDEQCTAEIQSEIGFDPEAGMFCAYSENEEALKKFILGFKQPCENTAMIEDLFSRAEID